ncbi:GntR family transcriptional regulator (plasmid) [Streptomyces xanthophaeus]|uniref:GntR family transcriptional regulator n=1 Tax=Streptomyces xanthophaeus TaxID=67385 RepID=UPI002F915F8C|nr:GntR family transcriptional regulator [Streptomyces xanthophaeus]WST27651.1 GntR family transcriptional regulator [Streptomyces xanthophaeus]WST65981.1 GntR family transcriptional regulator [Streptomyces xanthophaeus]WST66009.1 GntR family transcriptional regulator [Streptomyces xanthophaeus]
MEDTKIPKVQRLAAELREQILRGEFAPGSALPKIRDLQDTWGVAFQTVRDVYAVLENEGLIVSRKGKGTFVSPILGKVLRNGTGRYMKAAREEAGARGAFAGEIARLGMTPSSTTVITRERPPSRVAQILGMHHSSKAVARARTMLADDTVVQVATSWFPGDIAFGTQLEEQDTGDGGSKSRLADAGHAQVRIRESIDVRPPTKEEAEALGIPSGRAVYEITHVGITAEDRAVEVCVHVMPVTLWSLSYEWPIDQPEA